jgi:predicted cupin superfamily sugar epimerase
VNERVGALIAELGLAAHPEGGWYRETFRSTLAVRRDTRTHAVQAVRTVQAARDERSGADGGVR